MVTAQRLTKLPENDLLLVRRCPFCGDSHLHGAHGKDSPHGAGDGPRLAHCGAGDYDVHEVAA